MATIKELWNGVAGSVKLKLECWSTGFWFIPYFVDARGDVHGIDELNQSYWTTHTDNNEWRIYKEKPKLVTWYRPRVVWGRRSGSKDSSPMHQPEIIVCCPQQNT